MPEFLSFLSKSDIAGWGDGVKSGRIDKSGGATIYERAHYGSKKIFSGQGLGGMLALTSDESGYGKGCIPFPRDLSDCTGNG